MHFASGSCFPAEHSSWAVAAAAAAAWGRSSPCWGQSSEVTLGQTGCSNSCPCCIPVLSVGCQELVLLLFSLVFLFAHKLFSNITVINVW